MPTISPLYNLILISFINVYSCIYADDSCYDLYLQRFDDPSYKIGIDPITGENHYTNNGSYGKDWLCDIEGDEDIIAGESLEITDPQEGKYLLYIIGKSEGNYNVKSKLVNEAAETTSINLSGTISQGEIKKYLVQYSPISGQISEIYEYTPPGKPTNPTAEIGTQIKLTWEAPGNDGCLHWHTANTCHLSCLTG